ncbi:DUF983 domain-containing protein [Arundinibacter roseus]|uniref:DUF983 domain-containing protein n=1 Tax=Arundinibacter roseus TaxID=2070510 RepID=A0A4R4KCH8_9BACT|nr:DUF983 domain-containing protein [Arundinibacter roseus]TDB64512.1 DUF983 domain-containing protein [Arundinibacter roseus]
MLKGSKVYSILTNTCPKCNEGSYFVTNNPYNLKKFDKLNESCEFCQESFKREPGFYIGAMYVSYALSVALTVASFVVFVVTLDMDINYVLAALLPTIIILLPILFRTARIIWINIFVSYSSTKGEAARQMKAERKNS